MQTGGDREASGKYLGVLQMPRGGSLTHPSTERAQHWTRSTRPSDGSRVLRAVGLAAGLSERSRIKFVHHHALGLGKGQQALPTTISTALVSDCAGHGASVSRCDPCGSDWPV
jgi:hypothetical protein